MTTVKSINLYTRSDKIQKERYDKLQERTSSSKNSNVNKRSKPESSIVIPTPEQLELFGKS